MRFPNVALVIEPNANEMNMQCKRFYLNNTLFFFYQNVFNLGSYLLTMKMFSQNYIMLSAKKMLEDSLMQNPLRFLPKRYSQKRIV